MSHHDDERLQGEGAVDEMKGKAKEAWGDLTDDKSTQAEGKVDQAVGKTKRAVGDAMDKVEDAVDDDK